jgi:hypothetical protein
MCCVYVCVNGGICVCTHACVYMYASVYVLTRVYLVCVSYMHVQGVVADFLLQSVEGAGGCG